MATPRSKQELKEWILRELGSPVVEINLSEQQILDRIDDALEFWQEHHFDATQRVIFPHQVTQEDIDNKYIQLDQNWTAVIGVFKPSYTANGSSSDLFNIDYQLRLNDLWDLSNVNLSGYVISRQYLSLVDDILNTTPRIRYTKHEAKLYLDTAWDRFAVDHYLIIDGYKKVDPETNTSVWGDRIMRRLAAAYCKRQWGQNLGKFQNIQLPGGVTLNGDQMYDKATIEIKALEEEFISKWSEPPDMFVG